MIRKELRQRMRDRRAWVLPTLYLLVVGVVVVFARLTTADGFRGRVQGAEIGVVLFVAAVYAQLTSLLLIAPVFSASALTMEREQRTLASLLTSLLTPFEIWWGKFVAALLYQMLLMVSAVPVLSIAFAFGGVGLREVSLALGSTGLILASLSAVGLACSSVFRRTVHATAVTYAIVIALTVVSPVAFFLLGATLHGDKDWTEHVITYVLAVNPFFAISVGLFAAETGARLWLVSLAFYAVLAGAGALLAVRNIGRFGEQV